MKVSARLLLIIVTATLVMAAACGRTEPDDRLAMIAERVESAPEEALQNLDSIYYDSLSTADRHFYDFLTLKAKDKAYITHTSDSLILDLIEYYSSNNQSNLYPEVLYYGGRVYSDLGDFPTSLFYFQKAAELLPENSENQRLRCKVLSQTGRLLNTLRLYDDAVPYIKGAVDIDCALGDTINEIYDTQLLGSVYLRSHNFAPADSCFRLALAKSRYAPKSHRAKSSMYLAGVKFRLGEIDSALFYIRGVAPDLKPMARNSALAFASEIYYAAGICDTAFIYASELANSSDSKNKTSGYKILLSPVIRPQLMPGEVDKYMKDYLEILESYYNEHESQLAINQQAFFNYQIHERQKEEAKNANLILQRWLVSIVFALLLSLVLFMWIANRNKQNVIKLHQALENISLLEQSLKRTRVAGDNQKNGIQPVGPLEYTEETEHGLRERLRDKLYNLYIENQPIAVAPSIIQSNTYTRLQEYINEGNELKDDDFWNELKQLVLQVSPRFIENLHILVGGKLSTYDIKTSLLIKCGVQPTQMANLLNRTKGTIVSRRESLCNRIFGKKLGTKVIDGIIRLL